MPAPRIIHQPRARQALSEGMATLVKAIAPTLGPLPRRTAAQNLHRLELLDDGGVIARRIIALPDSEADAGAMLLRQAVWGAHQHVGDGAATTAVLYERIYRAGLRFLAAGADPMRLRAELLALLPRLRARLTAAARPLRGEAELRALAFSICHDEAMAAALANVIYTLGPHGQVDIREGHGRGMEYHFVEGSYWKGGAQSKEMLRGSPRQVAELHDAAIVVSDAEIEEPKELVPLMQMALRRGVERLLLIVESISDTGLSVVLDQRLRERIRTVVVKLDDFNPDDKKQAQDDIALLTGAEPILTSAGRTLEQARARDLGWARWVWADDENFGFASGKGDATALRGAARRLRAAYACAQTDDDRARLLNRLGRLNGGFATVHVGGIAKEEIRQRKDLAERTIRALRAALAGGVIAGGGIALWRCRDDLLARAEAAESLEARAAAAMLAEAVDAPIRQILWNAGYEPSEVLATLARRGACSGFDVMTGAAVDMDEAGVLDVARVPIEALRRAVSSAALALTIDVLVLHREPETATEP